MPNLPNIVRENPDALSSLTNIMSLRALRLLNHDEEYIFWQNELLQTLIDDYALGHLLLYPGIRDDINNFLHKISSPFGWGHALSLTIKEGRQDLFRQESSQILKGILSSFILADKVRAMNDNCVGTFQTVIDCAIPYKFLNDPYKFSDCVVMKASFKLTEKKEENQDITKTFNLASCYWVESRKELYANSGRLFEVSYIKTSPSWGENFKLPNGDVELLLRNHDPFYDSDWKQWLALST